MTPVAPADKATAIRITRAMAQPSATGKRGFLLWVQAAWPKSIANAVMNAAAKHIVPGSVSYSPGFAGFGYLPRRGSASGRMGCAPSRLGLVRPPTGGIPYPASYWRRTGMGAAPGMGFLGDDITPALTDISVSTPDVSSSVSDAVTSATDPGSADSSWVSDIASAFSSVLPSLGQAYLTKTQLSNAQTIFNTNLQRAQAGLPMIPTNPTVYGVPSPTFNLGLSQGTLTPLLWLGGGVLAVGLIASLARKH